MDADSFILPDARRYGFGLVLGLFGVGNATEEWATDRDIRCRFHRLNGAIIGATQVHALLAFRDGGDFAGHGEGFLYVGYDGVSNTFGRLGLAKDQDGCTRTDVTPLSLLLYS